MPSRALIIAIENYPVNPDLASTLPGTHLSAMAFRAWVKNSPAFANMTAADEPSRIIVCADDPAFPGRTHGTSGRAIRQAVYDLWTAGRDSTGELFVYYSGHGFLFKENSGSRAADVIVPGDFRTLRVDGNLCFPLDALQLELLSSMGPGNHYYFVDACRTLIRDEQIAVGSPVRLARSTQRAAHVFTLFSTNRFSTAPTASSFTESLLTGLSGRGKAKRVAGGTPAKMRVVWSSLVDYVKSQLPAVDGSGDAASPAVLWEGPVPLNTLTIVVDHANASDRFAVQPSDSLGRELAAFEFQGTSATWQQAPDDYRLEITSRAGAVRAEDPAPPNLVDLYEDAVARFSLDRGNAAGINTGFSNIGDWSGIVGAREEPAPTTRITVVAPEGSLIRMINPASGEVWNGQDTFSSPARPGASYVIEAYDRDKTLTLRQDVRLDPGEQRELDLRFPRTPLREAICSWFPSSRKTGVDFSESLRGAITDSDLGLWLSLIAASRVLGPERFRKLGALPLETFREVAPGFSALYVVSGFDEPVTGLRIGIAAQSRVTAWHTPADVDGLAGLCEFKNVGRPGGLSVSFALPNAPIVTIATYALANRATVVVVSGTPLELDIRQLLLPISRLEPHLEPMVHKRLPSSTLRGVKYLAQSQRLMARRGSILELTGQTIEAGDALSGRWLDPMAGIMVAYEMFRLGRIQELGVTLDNLALYFGELPDTTALLNLAGRPTARSPLSAPMVSDGFTAYPSDTFPALPEGRREHGTLWTTWRNAVERPGPDNERGR